MSLIETYKNHIIEQIMLNYLHEGEIPTSEDIEEALVTYQTTHLNLNEPKFKFINYLVNRVVGEELSSSASLIQEIKEVFATDISVITKEIYNLAQLNSTYFERWTNEIARLKTKSSILSTKIDSLLLLTNNTEGYYASVFDSFADLSLINTAETTAFVDITAHSLTIKPGTENTGSTSIVDTSSLTSQNITFVPLSKRNGTFTFNISTENSLVQMLKSFNSSWVGKITSLVTGPMTAELKINLNEEVNITKIIIQVASLNSNSGAHVTPQYSLDGYSWNLIPSSTATKSFNGTVIWNFKSITAKWIKFIIYKPIHDSGKYEYIYSISSIKFYGESYYEDNGNIFISNSLSVLDKQENLIGFTKAELSSCETLPENTNISYYFSASIDNETWTDWYSVIPAERTQSSLPKVINFSSYNKTNNLNEEALLASALSTEIVSSVDDEFTFPMLKNSNFGLINVNINIPENVDNNIVANTIEVWRNIRLTSSFPDSDTVRSIARGWHKENQTYSCYLEIYSSSGLNINFGNKSCILDGQTISGLINIPKGIHKFETDASNWFDIVSVIGDESLITEEYLASIDKLYPYNHKLLIEGLPYPSGFIGNKIYIGADLLAEYYCSRASQFDLENNITTLNYFSIKEIGDSTLAVILQRDLSNSDYNNEHCFVRWNKFNSSTELYKHIKLKATLLTDDSNITPVITSYKIKLGT